MKLPDFISKPDKDPFSPEGIQHVIDQVFPGHIGVKVTSVEGESISGYIDYSRKLANVLGILHGGATYTLADTLTGCLLYALHIHAVTGSADIRYLRPVSEGRVDCVCRITAREGRKIFLQGDFHQGETHIARARYTYIEVPRG